MKIPVAFVGNLDNPTVCGDCKGKCCQRCPGFTLPIELGAPDRKLLKKNIEARLRTSRWTLYRYEGPIGNIGNGAVHILRPAIKNFEFMTVGPPIGPCAFLGETGCGLSEAERPSQCRSLLPAPNYFTDYKNATCRGLGTEKPIESYALAWLPYNQLLINAEKKINLERASCKRTRNGNLR